jgi:cell division septum initiation protein DivIVA
VSGHLQEAREIASAIRTAAERLARAIDNHSEKVVEAAKIEANGRADAAGNSAIHRDVEGRR